ncbi:hypothetical protein WA171_005258 [Blastocystis sp. BT1]
MTTDINAILDRLSYVHACYSDPDCLVFEMMKLSPESIDCLFPTEKQPILSSLFDTVSSLGQFPFSESPFSRINFLQQLLYEADYDSYPVSAQRLYESEFVEWKTLPSKKAIKTSLVDPHLYKLFGQVRYVYYKPRCARFELSTRIVACAACDTLREVLSALQKDRESLSVEALKIQDKAIRSLIV